MTAAPQKPDKILVVELEERMSRYVHGTPRGAQDSLRLRDDDRLSLVSRLYCGAGVPLTSFS